MSRAQRHRAAIEESAEVFAEPEEAQRRTRGVAPLLAATWKGAADLQPHVLAQVKLANGDIHDGMRDRDSGKVYIFMPSGKAKAVPSIVGWLPKLGAMPALEFESYAITEVHDRVMASLRTLRHIRVERGPAGTKSTWPREWSDIADQINRYADALGHVDADGRYVAKEEGLAYAPEAALREVYTPTQRDLNWDRMMVPADWWARLRPGNRAYRKIAMVGLEAVGKRIRGGNPDAPLPPVELAEPSEQQMVVWYRSYAYPLPAGKGDGIRPPDWGWVGLKAGGLEAWAARRLFEQAIARMWFMANGGSL